jgi:hypothetical protein
LLEHHFSQDIQEMQRAAQGIELETIPYEHLRAEALRILPAEVATGLRAFACDELAGARRRYAAVLREMLEDRFSFRPFDAIVVPSDTFFYVREMPQIAHALGVPFLVAQKETTISEYTLREHAQEIRRFAPPCADRMTVCSERHKRFWLNAGGVAERILVTGQPRLDFYGRQPQRAERDAATRTHARGAPARNDAPGRGTRGAETAADRDERTVLFLSYAVDAYYPGEASEAPVWADLHRQTERGLHELAERGWRVLVKPHPQQSLERLQAWRREAKGLWGSRIALVDPQADARPLIATADAVVGFQSTAMLEAMLAGRPVIYTGWDPLALSVGDQLIPFERWRQEIAVVDDAASLADTVEAAAAKPCSASVLSRRRVIAESYLGPLDGHAAERTVAALREEAERWADRRGPAERQLRERLARRRRPLRLARRSRLLSQTLRRRLGAALGRGAV